MVNKRIKELIKENRIYNWEIAKVLNIHESTLSRWFREPLSDEQEKLISLAIEKIKLDQK